MSRCWPALLLMTALSCGAPPASERPDWAVAIHGGAGVVDRANTTPELDASYRRSLAAALDAGSKILREGGSALDAVEQTIRLMEDDPLFNAGRGAVFSAAGRNELDASIMDGATLMAGAAAGVRRVKHPISLARTIMRKSPHVMLAGEGADTFAAEQGLEIVDPSYFFTERRWQELERTLKARGQPVPEREHGTVGVAALDARGNVAAGTSTGGMTGKRWGRVGDSPIIGAGTYASNESCAVSSTGAGEYFIRLTVAREVCALVQHKGLALRDAVDDVVQKRLTALKGEGGVIAVSARGEIAWSFNTPGMYRASESATGARVISIYKDEP